MKYLGHSFSLNGICKPSRVHLPNWMKNVHLTPLKPDQKLTQVKEQVLPRLLFIAQNPCITERSLQDADLIRLRKKIFHHLNSHTPNQSIHEAIPDGSLGVLELFKAVPEFFLKRFLKIRD